MTRRKVGDEPAGILLHRKFHPQDPDRMAAWHRLMLGQLEAEATWPLLSSHLLFELRACPVCRRPVMRWRSLDEIKERVLDLAYQAAGGKVVLASRRLRMKRRTFYLNAPESLKKRIDATKEQRREARMASEARRKPRGGGTHGGG